MRLSVIKAMTSSRLCSGLPHITGAVMISLMGVSFDDLPLSITLRV
jgi:hypothetical protein